MSGKGMTAEQQAFVREHYNDMPDAVMADKIGATICQIHYFRNREHLKKSPEYLSNLFREYEKNNPGFHAHQFPKGHTPFTKGKKMTDYISDPEKLRNIRAHTFKKGGLPHNTRELGSITWREDKNRKTQGYYFIKYKDDNWKKNMMELHRYIWIQKYGPVPEGMNVVFRDGNHRHCTLDNLELISDEEQMQRNTIHRYPEELKSAIRLISKTQKIIEKCKKQH